MERHGGLTLAFSSYYSLGPSPWPPQRQLWFQSKTGPGEDLEFIELSGPRIIPDQIRDSASLERALLLGQGGSWAKTLKPALEKIYITSQIKQSSLSPLMHINMIRRSVSSCFPTGSPGSLHVKQGTGTNVYTSS